MSEIVVEGHKIDTKDIYDIVNLCNTRKAGFLIKMIEKPDIEISEKIPYETYNHEFSVYYAPYKRLMSSIKEKWEADKTELPIFKL